MAPEKPSDTTPGPLPAFSASCPCVFNIGSIPFFQPTAPRSPANNGGAMDSSSYLAAPAPISLSCVKVFPSIPTTPTGAATSASLSTDRLTAKPSRMPPTKVYAAGATPSSSSGPSHTTSYALPPPHQLSHESLRPPDTRRAALHADGLHINILEFKALIVNLWFVLWDTRTLGAPQGGWILSLR